MKTKAKDTVFYKTNTLLCRGFLLDMSAPLVMGILNVSPDSFFNGSSYLTEKSLIAGAGQMLDEGAAILDIGGYSSKPGAEDVAEKEELKRVLPAIKSIVKEFPDAVISIDTFRSNVAKQAIESGAAIINDISGGSFDEKMFDTAAGLKTPYILVHIQGTPQNMQINPVYKNVVKEVIMYFSERVSELRSRGVHDIILDPGFGFGKTLEHNYEILRKLDNFKIFGLPLMVGVSRKSMINKILKSKPEEALNGTTVLNTIALTKGVKILRVHDVKEAVEAIKLYFVTSP